MAKPVTSAAARGSREHALDLRFVHGRVRQLAAAASLQQLVIRALAPQEERQARGQLEVAERLRRHRPSPRGGMAR